MCGISKPKPARPDLTPQHQFNGIGAHEPHFRGVRTAVACARCLLHVVGHSGQLPSSPSHLETPAGYDDHHRTTRGALKHRPKGFDASMEDCAAPLITAAKRPDPRELKAIRRDDGTNSFVFEAQTQRAR